MNRVKPETPGDHEWRGRCDGGHPLRLVSPGERDGEMPIEPEAEYAGEGWTGAPRAFAIEHGLT